MGYIYQITNNVNGKFYIGSTVNDKRRRAVHFSKLRKNKHCNCYLQAAWNKYGESAFDFKIIDTCDGSYSDLLCLEQHWINKVDACNNGYNLNPLVLQPPITKGTKKPTAGKRNFGQLINPDGQIVEFVGIREFARSHSLSHVCVALMVKGKMGQHRGWKTIFEGISKEKYIPTEQHKKNLSKAKLGVKRPKDVCEKIRKSHIGKKHSTETKKKISDARKNFVKNKV